jgi:hypothetical protein
MPRLAQFWFGRFRRTAWFVAAVMLHSFGVVFISMVTGFVPDAVIPNFYGGAYALGAFPPVTIAIAVVLGVLISRSCRDGRAVWAWVPALLWLAWGISASGWSHEYVFHNFFTNKCGSTECLYELFYTAPLVVSVAYSSACWIALRLPPLSPKPPRHVSEILR